MWKKKQQYTVIQIRISTSREIKKKKDSTNDEDDYEDGVETVTPAGADFLVCYGTAEGRLNDYCVCDKTNK